MSFKISNKMEGINVQLSNIRQEINIQSRKDKPQYCLGIESTADDFSVGIVSFEGEVLSNIISAYIPERGGIHPREAARHHAKVAASVIVDALNKACLLYTSPSPRD